MKNEPIDWKWADYRSFSTITTQFQTEIYSATADLLQGASMLDVGCGSCKLAAFIRISHYVGLDSSPIMEEMANEVLKRLSAIGTKFEFFRQPIETYNPGKLFANCVSINSIYTWENPAENLQRIAACLQSGGRFILASPNKNLSMEKLLREATKSLLMHPHLDEFVAFNMALAQKGRKTFFEMDELIEMASPSFKVEIAHQDFFMGGINYVVFKKRN